MPTVASAEFAFLGDDDDNVELLIKLDGDRDFFSYGPISKEMVNGFLEAGLVNPPIEDMD